MADAPQKENSVVRTPDGIFYKIPNDVLKQYAVPPEELKDVLSQVKKGPGPGPAGGPQRGGGPFVINVNLGEALRGMMPGAPGGGQRQPAAAGAVAGYCGCGHSCYHSCYSSCYRSCC